MSRSDLETLTSLLQRRLETIDDAELRERDPTGQLARLQEVSEAIADFHQTHRPAIQPRLHHFLENCSYQKALEWAEAELAKGG